MVKKAGTIPLAELGTGLLTADTACRRKENPLIIKELKMEARTGLEPVYEILQTSA